MKQFLVIVLMLGMLMKTTKAQEQGASYMDWKLLPSLPDSFGFAGAFAGVSNNVLLVAGGANFPDGGAPWTGSTKVWYDKVFALDKPGGQWKEAGKLPMPLGYGVSLTWKDAMVCIGGSDAAGHHAKSFLVRYNNGKIETEKLPSLPHPLANGSGVLIGNKAYVIGGTETPQSTEASNVCLSLDLSAPKDQQKWITEKSFPGPSRILAVTGTLNNELYVFSGAHLYKDNADQQLKRKYLKDAWKYNPEKGWQQLADLPEPAVAAPSPAFAFGQSHLLIAGGDHGKLADKNAELKDNHPGFSDIVWSYNTITNTWAQADTVLTEKRSTAAADPNSSTWAPVTTPAVVWNGSLVLPSGEVRPAVRTPKVLMGTPVHPPGKFSWIDWGVVAIYFMLVIGISVFVSRKMESNTSDFFLGGGKIPWWAAGLSIFGSKLSALTFIAIPAKAYATDWVYLLNNLMIVAVAPIVVYFYLPYFRKLKLTSVYEYLQVRFSPAVKITGSLTFVIFQISRLGIVIYLPALVLSAVTGINIFACIIGVSLITTAYSVAGGIEAVVWTEVMQVGVLLGGAFCCLVFIANSLDGGFGQLFSEAASENKFRMAILESDITQPVLWVVLVGGFLTQLVTYSSDQVVVQRYLTTSSEKEARKSIYTNAVLVIPASLIFFMVGTALWVYFRHNPASLNPNGRVDDVFPWYISQELPTGLAGLVIAGLFAATMSTISSSMNSIATVVTTDFYKHFKPSSTDKQQFIFARYTTVVLGALGCLIAIYMVFLNNTSIWDQYLKIIGLFGGCLAGMFLAGIFFPKINSRGVMAGFVVSAIALYFIQDSGAINFFLYPAAAVLLCVTTAYIVSLIAPDKKQPLRAV
ncbi:sodium:solute symporter family transporter [Pseudobacter ginsenosidimutans]|nr:sodium/solute symporter [Pseudobacter ginsenosidimutans]QEC45246.1 sodium/solute symporter [Pseudobacter ginsenosidimutans]